MTMSSHIQELRKKHETLSHKVEQAQRSPGVDDLIIKSLKKEKMKIKEEIDRLQHS